MQAQSRARAAFCGLHRSGWRARKRASEEAAACVCRSHGEAAPPRRAEPLLQPAPSGGAEAVLADPPPAGPVARRAQPLPKTQATRVKPAAAGDRAREPPTCPICMQELIDEQEALLCGHVMHSGCVERMCEVNQCEKTEACPYRCHRTPSFAAASHAHSSQGEVAEQTGALPGPEGEEQPLAPPVPETEEGQDEEGAPGRTRTPEYISDVESVIDAALAQAEEDAQRASAQQ